jgi:hypothetical protein
MGDSYRVDGSHNGDNWYCPSYQEHASILKGDLCLRRQAKQEAQATCLTSRCRLEKLI